MAEKLNEGGAAFPRAMGHDRVLRGTEQTGMSLRDYFAAKAMQGVIGTSGAPWFSRDAQTARMAAEVAYEIADAMLKARAVPRG